MKKNKEDMIGFTISSLGKGEISARDFKLAQLFPLEKFPFYLEGESDPVYVTIDELLFGF